ncbi:MAG: ABC transporter ATP-binding protein [Defluviitaleaceae bacterium]|nr:ABC transporter ATP-binding protein [Defluviitaleaceae bacterium]
MPVLEIKNLTKDYGFGRGVFDVDFNVDAGECYGFLGPNGAGKTTTIRHIMGFSKPQKGETLVNGKDSWSNYHQIQKTLGYLPGEIALPENLTGNQFIKMMADLRGMSDMSYTQTLIKQFELEPKGSLKRMSLGMKRKLAIVTAFMHDPDILVLDEPTSGLDPVMQDIFIQFIKAEKERGKTILLSSHIFSEVDATCDKISIIKDGRLVSSFVAADLKHSENKTFKIEFGNNQEFERFCADAKALGFISTMDDAATFKIASIKAHRNQANIRVCDTSINQFLEILSNYQLKFFSEIKFTLEDYFMNFYDRKKSVDDAKEVFAHAAN